MDLLRTSQRGLILPGGKPSTIRLPRGITGYWPLDAANCEFGSGQVRPLDLIGNNFGADAKSAGAAGLPPFDGVGIGYNFDATPSTYLALNSDPFGGVTGPNVNATLLIWAYYRSFSGSNGAPRIWEFASDVITPIDEGTSGITGAGSLALQNDSLGIGKFTNGPVLSLNRWTHIAATISAGVCTGIYIDGGLVGMSSTYFGFSSNSTNNLGCRDSTNRIMDGKLAHCMVCNGTVLTAAEIADVYYSAFLPDEVLPVLKASSGSVLTLTANQGTYIVNGIAATPNSARIISINPGAYVLSGKATTLNRGRTLTATQGAYSLTGVAITTSHAINISAAKGSFTISGTATSLLQGKSIAAGKGTFTLTGNAAANPVALTLQGTKGTYVVNGIPATLTYTSINAPAQTHFLPFLVTVGPISAR